MRDRPALRSIVSFKDSDPLIGEQSTSPSAQPAVKGFLKIEYLPTFP